MGKEKYQREIEDLFRKSPVVSYKSIERLIKNKKNVKQYSKQLVRNLLLKGKIKKLAKGSYTYFDDASLAVFCFKPAYLGLQDSLSFYNLWEQETIPVVITARKARSGVRKILNANVMVRRVNKKYLFGFEYFSSGDFYLPYSDIEKTFIDMVYFKERLSDEAIKEMKKSISKSRLDSYLKVYPKRIKKTVLNLLE